LTGIFKANNPLNNLLLFIYGLLLKLGWFLSPQIPIPQKEDGFFFKAMLLKLQSIGANTPLVYSGISYILLFTQAIVFNKIINDQKLMQRSNYLPAMSYLLITSLFSEWNVLSAPLIINTLLILVWASMSNLYNNPRPKSALYNIGLMIGLCTFFYFPSLGFILLIIFGLIFSRPFILAEWIVAVLGIVTPYYFLFAYLFLTDKLKGYKLSTLNISLPHFNLNNWQIGAVSLVALSFLTGAFFVQANFRKQLVQVRKRWNLVLLYLTIAFIVPFINNTNSFEYWILTAIPLSAYIGAAFLYPVKRWFPLLLHWLMVLIVIVLSYNLKY
jgi:hypothetical protein